VRAMLSLLFPGRLESVAHKAGELGFLSMRWRLVVSCAKRWPSFVKSTR
jgi:hypothetical protein